MFTCGRAVRTHPVSTSALTSLRPSRPNAPRLHNFNPKRQHRSFRLTAPSPTVRSARPQFSAIDPTTFIVVGSISLGIAYFAATYTDRDPKPISPSEDSINSDEDLAIMAPSSIPPGRPGNLTPDQTEKLKEMWLATLEVFGVAEHDSSHSTTNGASSAGSTTGSIDEKKKRKSRLSLFGSKKDKSGANSNTESNNDKHGQTKEFEQALASQSPEELRKAFWSMVKHDNPDALLLRFLRARKWDIQAALIMLVSTMHWRSQEMHVDDRIMVKGEEHALKDSKSSNAAEKKEGEDFLAQLRMGKSFLHGTDKEGRPCCYVRVKLHRQGEQTEKSLEQFTVYTIETARMMLRPPVDTATIVFDMTDFSMANMDYTPVKFMIKCFEANYPESLGSVLVYKSPWVFQGIWKIIKGWLDPVVASKVHFASNAEELSAFVPKDKLPKGNGGMEDWEYAYPEPVVGENKMMEDTAAKDKIQAERVELVKSYEGETLSWLHGEDQGEGRSRLAERLAQNYWRLDPYVRAKSLYDRVGVLGEAGKLDFYPKNAVAAGGATDGAGDDID